MVPMELFIFRLSLCGDDCGLEVDGRDGVGDTCDELCVLTGIDVASVSGRKCDGIGCIGRAFCAACKLAKSYGRNGCFNNSG